MQNYSDLFAWVWRKRGYSDTEIELIWRWKQSGMNDDQLWAKMRETGIAKE